MSKSGKTILIGILVLIATKKIVYWWKNCHKFEKVELKNKLKLCKVFIQIKHYNPTKLSFLFHRTINEIKIAILLSNERSSHESRNWRGEKNKNCREHFRKHTAHRNQFMKNSFVSAWITGAKMLLFDDLNTRVFDYLMCAFTPTARHFHDLIFCRGKTQTNISRWSNWFIQGWSL